MNFLKKIYAGASKRKALKQQYLEAEGIFGQGYVLFEMGNFDEALSNYEKAAVIWDDLGSKLIENEMPDEAKKAHTKASDARYSRCFLLHKIGREDEALEVITSSIEEAPDDAGRWFSKGFVLNSAKRYDEALEAFNHALEISPDFSEALYCKGNILYMRENYDDALDCYEKAEEHAGVMYFSFPRYSFLNLRPDPQLKNDSSEILYAKGNSLYQLGRYEDAVEAFRQVLGRKPRFVPAWQGLVNSYLKLGQEDDALMTCDHALEVEAGKPELIKLKASVCAKTGRNAESEELLASLVEET
ncbi:tetratricopeptide (TPR) repeat protein [Methanohalophilus levihalophilus]|uniref:tetratricopeptide repeat protein n=1 Tax=Methanohalophilus levihalophilus TaxID=1431282 RepID=UPI001AE58250|nr:tetratricopeptide repeat protein [Methanohalophilus levihalophilus]MBP2029325.1 tetratricopeptide (TPR) repeat protein [Methanohalophilus levihalophilus]